MSFPSVRISFILPHEVHLLSYTIGVTLHKFFRKKWRDSFLEMSWWYKTPSVAIFTESHVKFDQ